MSKYKETVLSVLSKTEIKSTDEVLNYLSVIRCSLQTFIILLTNSASSLSLPEHLFHYMKKARRFP